MGSVIKYFGLGITCVLVAVIFIKKGIYDYYRNVMP